MIDYSNIFVSNYDKEEGIGPQLLTVLKNRAKIITNNAMCPGLDMLATEMLRGQHKEVIILLQALKKLGVVEKANIKSVFDD